MNIIFLIIVCISPIVGMILIYNLIYFLKNKKELKNIDLEKIRERIKKYRTNFLYSFIILGVLLAFIFIYTRPVSIYEITGLDSIDKIESLNTRGNISYEIEGLDNVGSSSELKINYLSEEKIEKLFDVLDNYKYKRTFNHETGATLGEFFHITGEDKNWVIVELRRIGYLRIPNDKVYRIDSENREDLYEELEEKMKSWKF